MEEYVNTSILRPADAEEGLQQLTWNHPGMQLTEVPLEENEIKPRVKKAKRIVYFSDGAVEEYSDDEMKPDKQPVDTKPSTWSSYIIESLDHMGEKLAWFFGITSPKYQYAIDEYWRRKKEEEEEKEIEAREKAAAIERRGRRNIAMDKEVEVSVVSLPDIKVEPVEHRVNVMCEQPMSISTSNSPLVEAKSGHINEGFDDSFKF